MVTTTARFKSEREMKLERLRFFLDAQKLPEHISRHYWLNSLGFISKVDSRNQFKVDINNVVYVDTVNESGIKSKKVQCLSFRQLEEHVRIALDTFLHEAQPKGV